MAKQQQNRNQKPAPQQRRTERYSVSTPVEGRADSHGEIPTFWRTCGTAFKGQKGFSIILDALPVNGRLFISHEPAPERQEELPL